MEPAAILSTGAHAAGVINIVSVYLLAMARMACRQQENEASGHEARRMRIAVVFLALRAICFKDLAGVAAPLWGVQDKICPLAVNAVLACLFMNQRILVKDVLGHAKMVAGGLVVDLFRIKVIFREEMDNLQSTPLSQHSFFSELSVALPIVIFMLFFRENLSDVEFKNISRTSLFSALAYSSIDILGKSVPVSYLFVVELVSLAVSISYFMKVLERHSLFHSIPVCINLSAMFHDIISIFANGTKCPFPDKDATVFITGNILILFGIFMTAAQRHEDDLPVRENSLPLQIRQLSCESNQQSSILIYHPSTGMWTSGDNPTRINSVPFASCMEKMHVTLHAQIFPFSQTRTTTQDSFQSIFEV